MTIGTETSQYKMEPEILSQVNRIFPPGQTDTIPEGDSVMAAPMLIDLNADNQHARMHAYNNILAACAIAIAILYP